MLRSMSPCALLLLALVLFGADRAAAENDRGPEPQLIQEKAPAVVSLKFVLQISFTMGGQAHEMERSGTALGIVVDPTGLIMVRANAFEARIAPRAPGRGRRGGGGDAATPEINATPTNIRVVVPGEEKEYVGVMGAKDSASGLAFVLVKGLAAGKQFAAADFSKAATPGIGEDLYAVSRLDQGYDHAAFCDRVRVIGKVTKPKPMWIIDERLSYVGLPLYTATGAVAGVVGIQEGVGEGAGTRAFLMPLDSVKRTIASAAKEAERLREEQREAEDEAAAAKKAEEKKDAEKKDDEKKDDEKKDDDK